MSESQAASTPPPEPLPASDGQAPTASEASVIPDTIVFTDEEGKVLRDLDHQITQKKLVFADLSFKALKAHQQTERAALEIVKAEERIQERIGEFAQRSYHIDLTDPSKGRWIFNAQTMTLRRAP